MHVRHAAGGCTMTLLHPQLRQRKIIARTDRRIWRNIGTQPNRKVSTRHIRKKSRKLTVGSRNSKIFPLDLKNYTRPVDRDWRAGPPRQLRPGFYWHFMTNDHLFRNHWPFSGQERGSNLICVKCSHDKVLVVRYVDKNFQSTWLTSQLSLFLGYSTVDCQTEHFASGFPQVIES